MFLRTRLLFALAAALLASCVRIERHTTNIGVPTAMLGAWTGGWSSSTGGGQGSVTLHLQTFDQHPVVQVQAVHPCLRDGAYEFRMAGLHLELLRDSVVVFVGDVDLAARRLVGSYECAADRGVWSANWTNDLEPIGNIGGTWVGTFVAGSGPPANFTMEVEQRWSLGFLQLVGEVVVDGFGVGFPISRGEIDFHGTGFDLLLRGNQLGTSVLLQGNGDLAGAPTCSGVMIVEDIVSPFVAGTWSAVRTGP